MKLRRPDIISSLWLLSALGITVMLNSHSLAAIPGTGTVAEVHGATISVKLASGQAPTIGDTAELSFKLGGEQFTVGTWRVIQVSGPQFEAVRIKANLDAAPGMNVRIVNTASRVEAQPVSPQNETLRTITVPRTAVAISREPLRIMATSSYQLVWKDKGSGARRDFGVWRPVAWNGFYPLGDVANASPWPDKRYPPPAFGTLVVKGGKAPVGYRQVWNTAGSHPQQPFSSWTPVPAPGYVCLGDVGSASLDTMPPLDVIHCLPQQCVVEIQLKEKIWDDKDSGAYLDFSAWLIPGVNVYAGNASHKKPGGVFHTIKPECL